MLRQLDAEDHSHQTVKFDLKDSSRLAGSANQGAFCSEAEDQSAQEFIASLLDRGASLILMFDPTFSSFDLLIDITAIVHHL